MSHPRTRTKAEAATMRRDYMRRVRSLEKKLGQPVMSSRTAFLPVHIQQWRGGEGLALVEQYLECPAAFAGGNGTLLCSEPIPTYKRNGVMQFCLKGV